MTADAAPLLVTLAMDAASAEYFNAERQRYFPPARNHLAAHITLFHQLPAAEEAAVRRTLAEVAARTPAFCMHTSAVWLLGFGVAYLLESRHAQDVQASLKQAFAPWLTPQDANRAFKPHITVQNKVAAETAKTLHAALAARFTPRAVQAVGLDLWRYLGGPWEHRARFDFPL